MCWADVQLRVLAKEEFSNLLPNKEFTTANKGKPVGESLILWFNVVYEAFCLIFYEFVLTVKEFC